MTIYNTENTFKLIQESTYIQNVNTGVAQPPDHFGATTQEGMQHSKGANPNNAGGGISSPNNVQADLTLPQSNYMNPKRVF